MSKRSDQAKRSVPITHLLGSFGFRVRDSDRKQWIGCHLHGSGQDSKPSAAVYPDTNSWYCWGCGKARNTIQTVMECKGIGFGEAIRWLEQTYQLAVIDDGFEHQAPRAVTLDFNPTETSEQIAHRVDSLLASASELIPAERRAKLWFGLDVIQGRLHDGGLTEETAKGEMRKIYVRFFHDLSNTAGDVE